MRAVTVEKTGGVDVLRVTRRSVRAAGPGEVRIAVRAAAVNPTDILVRQRGAGPGLPPPWIPGMDAAGVVESVGPGSDKGRLRVGEEVMAVATPRRPEGGAQIEQLVVPAASVVAAPRGVTLAQAATLPMNGLTAWLGLEMAGLSPRQTLAVSGGAGWLAYLVIVLAKQRGLRVLADAKPAEEELVRGYGADVVVARGEGFCAALRGAVPGGVDGLFDTALLGRAAFPAIRDGGVYVPVRGWDGSPAERGIRIEPVMVSEALERTDWLTALADLATRRVILLRVAAEYPVERVADAQAAMAAGGLRGRAVLTF